MDATTGCIAGTHTTTRTSAKVEGKCRFRREKSRSKALRSCRACRGRSGRRRHRLCLGDCLVLFIYLMPLDSTSDRTNNDNNDKDGDTEGPLMSALGLLRHRILRSSNSTYLSQTIGHRGKVHKRTENVTAKAGHQSREGGLDPL